MSTQTRNPQPAVELTVGGMTCASCAARVEKKLNKLPGVVATVNYSTEKATIQLPENLTLTDAIATIEATGYTAAPVTQEMDDPADGRSLKIRLIVSTVLTVPVVLLAMVAPLQFDYWQWVSLVLTTPVVLWGAWPFHRATLLNLRHGNTTMDTLISLGVSAAYLWSVYALIFGSAGEPGMRMEFSLLPSHTAGASEIYFEVAAAVTVFLLFGRYLEERAKTKSSQALSALLSLGAKEVTLLENNEERTIPIEFLKVGNHFVVRPGERIATDGVVVEGNSAVDASMITGESIPVEVELGSVVVGSTINENGRLVIKATAVGADTALARITSMVEQAQAGKAPVQRLADRVSTIFVPVVLVLSLLTLTGWLIFGSNVTFAFTAAVAVLIIACPCALGLATPTALMVGTGRGAQLGILIRGPQILESTHKINTIVLDKTGTVTTGRMSVHAIHAMTGVLESELLRVAGAIEAASEHPIANAIVAKSKEHSEIPAVTDFLAIRGGGVRGLVETKSTLAGSPTWVSQELNTDINDPWIDRYQSQGMTVIAVAQSGELLGFIAVADTIKPDSQHAITQFKELGLTPILLTGDNNLAAEFIAQQVGITRVYSDVMPEDKVAAITQLQAEGKIVAMVGDGVNDAAALVQADLGMSMGSGTDVAIEASDITLVNSNLTSAATGIELARKTLSTIKGNLFWAFAYNVAAIPLAMAGLLNPMIAGAAMAFSSVFVVTNSLRLRRFHE
jgi:Cu+-exporting ATPase